MTGLSPAMAEVVDCNSLVENDDGDWVTPGGCWFAGSGGGDVLLPAADPVSPNPVQNPAPAPATVANRVINVGDLLRDPSRPGPKPAPGDATRPGGDEARSGEGAAWV